MNDQEQPPDFSQIEHPPVPEGWAKPTRPRRSWPIFNRQTVFGLFIIGVAALVAVWFAIAYQEQRQWRKDYAREMGRDGFKSSVQAVVRWDYKIVTIKAGDQMKGADGSYDSSRYQRAMESKGEFYFGSFSEMDKAGEVGWELVSVTPNFETVFPNIKDYQGRGEPKPNTRVAELLLFFKRPSKYEADTDQELWAREKRYKEYEAERATNKTTRP